MLAVAGVQVCRSGSRAVTLDTVCRETGCAKGLVTYHFGGRDQLLAATAVALFASRQERWHEAVTQPSIEAAIGAVFELLTAEVREGLWRAWVSLSAEGTDLTVQAVNAAWTAFTASVSGSVSGLLRANDLESAIGDESLGRLFAAGVQGLGLQLHAGVPVEEVENTHTALWAALMGLTRRRA